MLAVCIGRGFDWNTIISTFALHDGIGYVWIVRIYLIAAAIVPIVGYVSNNNEQEKKNRFSFRREVTAAIIVIFLLLIQELLCGMGIFSLNIFTKDILAYILPLFAITIYTSSICKNTSNKVLIFYTILYAFIFSVCLSISIIETGNIVGTQSAKYPFRIYYSSYALAVTSGLILLLRNRKISDILSSKFVVFVSSMSFWIYLWHIPIIMILQSHFGALPWITKFLIAFVGSSIISYSQLRLVRHLEKCYGRKEVFKVMKG